ncbi:MAG: TRAP transporter substrate-binding protein [Oscillospiraceae bacterium]|nr:TRAP transporter substrate-binding protein [Oscillospiraceae bacterium]
MKLKKALALVLALVMCVGIFAACGGTTTTPPADSGTTTTPPADSGTSAPPADVDPGEVIEISFAHDKATTHPVHLRYEAWAADLEEATGGRVKINFYPAQTLLTLAESYEGVKSGIADISVVTPALTPGVFPMLELFDLPVHYNNAVVLSQVYMDCIQNFDLKELEGVKVLNVYCMGPGAIATNSPIQNLDDLKGEQIRAIGLSGAAMGALGASPVSVAMPETYEALMRGTCDGVLGGLGAMTTWNLIEVADCFTITPFLSVSSFIVMMNEAKWNSIPADLQAIIEEVCAEHNVPYVQGEENEALASIDKFLELGKEVYAIGPEEEAKWMELMQPVIDEAIADREDDGPAREFYNTMIELAEKYNEGTQSYYDYYLEVSGK